MRAALAVFVAPLFAVLFIVALLAFRVVNTAGDPDTMAGILDDAGVYDFVYDRALDAAISDITAKGIEIGGEEGSEPQTLVFEDQERARVALKGFIETILPREYVREKVAESLDGIVPYATGQADSFTVDFETGERIEAFPDALRFAAAEIELGELISQQVIAPLVADIGDSFTDQAFGVSFSGDEAQEAASTIMPPEWLEARLFDIADDMAPYLSGREDELEINVTFRDRVPVAGQILKQKVDEEDLLVEFVFGQVIDPMVADFVGGNTALSYGIEVTPEDVQEAVAIVAPEDWVREQGDALIDTIIAWLMGVEDDLVFSLDLRDRKAEAIVELEALAYRKLEEQVAATPVCTTVPEALAAGNEALNGMFPSCLPDNAEAMLDQMQPMVSAELQDFISASLPDELTYSDQQFRSQLPPDSLETLDDLRDRVINGIVITEDGLAGMFSGDEEGEGGGEPDEGEVSMIDRIRSGLRFDETDLASRMEPEQQAQFEKVRGWVGLGWDMRWVIFLPSLLVLLLVAFIGGRGWRGRGIWAGGAMTAVTLAFFVAITVGWAATSSFREFSVAGDGFSAETRAEFPALTELLESGEVEIMLERTATAWVSGLAYSAVPWAAAGIVIFALAFLYPRYAPMLGRTGGDGARRVRSRDGWASAGYSGAGAAAVQPGAVPAQASASASDSTDESDASEEAA